MSDKNGHDNELLVEFESKDVGLRVEVEGNYRILH